MVMVTDADFDGNRTLAPKDVIRVECWDWDALSKDDPMGYFIMEPGVHFWKQGKSVFWFPLKVQIITMACDRDDAFDDGEADGGNNLLIGWG